MSNKLQNLPTQLPFEGVNNFRDMGGYPLAQGRRVKEGLLFRSDHFSNLTDTDYQLLEKLGIKTVIDLRSHSERDLSPNRFEPTVIQEIHLPINVVGANVNELIRQMHAGELDMQFARQFLLDANIAFIHDFTQTFKEFFQYLLDENNYPLVFHCSAGKDRTGFCAAISLICLGADLDTVFHDYLATNHCTAEYIENYVNDMVAQGMKTPPDVVTAMLQVQEEFLQTAFDVAIEKHSSVEQYLELELQMDAVKRKFLSVLLTE